MVVEIDSVGLDRILAFDGEHFDGPVVERRPCWFRRHRSTVNEVREDLWLGEAPTRRSWRKAPSMASAGRQSASEGVFTVTCSGFGASHSNALRLLDLPSARPSCSLSFAVVFSC